MRGTVNQIILGHSHDMIYRRDQSLSQSNGRRSSLKPLNGLGLREGEVELALGQLDCKKDKQ
jgi:hypothetical protein